MPGATLTIDLDAIAANWHRLAGRMEDVECAAVVKADAYGLGLDQVAPALASAGCRTFFVALFEEAAALRRLLPDAAVYVLNGLDRGAEADYAALGLRPVLNGLDDIAAWSAFARSRERALPAALHLDTGMARLGLPFAEARVLAAEPGRLEGIDLRLVMSHLASADEPDHPDNARQLAGFRALRALFPQGKASLANSSGLFLGAGWRFDLGRPGAALYGVNPCPTQPNPMAQVVSLQGKILQVRAIDSGESVGYGATWRASRPSRIATVAAGYGDGYLRSLSNSGFAWLGDIRVPVVGRVSMDLITLDATDVPGALVHPGAAVELLGPQVSVDALAGAAGTIGYEILTALGRRYRRVYIGGCAGT
ncbi:MAG: alanine racemase [Magnetospirillum sp. WYHS-4]